jgi:hypothetical protein
MEGGGGGGGQDLRVTDPPPHPKIYVNIIYKSGLVSVIKIISAKYANISNFKHRATYLLCLNEP